MKLRWVLAAAAIGLTATAAQARDVYWSVGVQAAPGVSLGVSNSPPLYVAPAPVYVAPPPVVYVRPAPVYYSYYRPEPVVYYGGHWKAKKHKHWKHRH